MELKILNHLKVHEKVCKLTDKELDITSYRSSNLKISIQEYLSKNDIDLRNWVKNGK